LFVGSVEIREAICHQIRASLVLQPKLPLALTTLHNEFLPISIALHAHQPSSSLENPLETRFLSFKEHFSSFLKYFDLSLHFLLLRITVFFHSFF
jgi:hypothetical protein